MTENSNSNDDNGAGQIAMTDDLFGWPGDGVHCALNRLHMPDGAKVSLRGHSSKAFGVRHI
jgi:hypothetical protein